MNWKGSGRKRPWPNLKYYPCICLEILENTTKDLSQDIWSPDRDFNPRPADYEAAGVLPTLSRCSFREGYIDIDRQKRSIYDLFCEPD
jgi:hypothetical protein